MMEMDERERQTNSRKSVILTILGQSSTKTQLQLIESKAPETLNYFFFIVIDLSSASKGFCGASYQFKRDEKRMSVSEIQ